jgi:hypothetical protein
VAKVSEAEAVGSLTERVNVMPLLSTMTPALPL